jgi:short-subunit dehydrogenase
MQSILTNLGKIRTGGKQIFLIYSTECFACSNFSKTAHPPAREATNYNERMFKNKVILVTGGSSGLGLAISRAFGKSGGKVILLARDEQKLANSVEQLRSEGVTADFVVADVLAADQVNQVAAEIQNKHGGIDVLVNNVGVSDRGRITDQTPEALAKAMDVNLYSMVRCTQAFLPQLLEKKGSIINIGTLASKVVSPFLGSYPTTKFAVDAYSRQLRVELRSDGVHVLLVCPGPLAREDAGSRYQEKSGQVPDSAMQPGGGARLRRIDPDDLATKIVRACHRRKSEMILPLKTRMLIAIYALSPEWGDWVIRKMVKSDND